MYDLDPAIFERRDAQKPLRLPAAGPRELRRELAIARECLGRVVADTDDHVAIFELLNAFPLADVLRANHRWLPITRKPSFQRLFEARSLPALDLGGVDALRALPQGTLGHQYAAFVDAHRLDDAYLDYCPLPDDAGGYLAYRMVLLHDLIHFVTGFTPGQPLEEAQLEAFLLAQTGAFNHVLFMGGFALNFIKHHPRLLLALPRALFAAFAQGLKAENLVLVEWQAQLARPVDEVRRELGLGGREGSVASEGGALRSVS